METLAQHRAVCVEYLNKSKTKIVKNAQVLLELLSTTESQIAINLPFPSGKAFMKFELAVPDRRKKAEHLLFLVLVKKHKKIPDRYQIEICPHSVGITYPLRIGALYHASGLQVDIACKSFKEKARVILFDIHSINETFKLWIFAF